MIRVKTFVFNGFQENTFVLSVQSGECVIIDPGCNSKLELEELLSYLKEENLQPGKVVLTHGHVDHIMGCKMVCETYQLPLYIHPDDEFLLQGSAEYASFFGFEIDQPPAVKEYLSEDKDITLGDSSLKVLHVPGHSPGSTALYSAKDKFAIVGDVLFRNSIGRTDLPGGNYNTLITSITQKLLTLPPETVIYPGHGPITTIGEEHDTNPFLK